MARCLQKRVAIVVGILLLLAAELGADERIANLSGCESVRVATVLLVEASPSFIASFISACLKALRESWWATWPISWPITPNTSSSVITSINPVYTLTLPSAHAKAFTSLVFVDFEIEWHSVDIGYAFGDTREAL